jgi:hypothetical protein
MAPGRTSVSGQESVLKPGSRRLLLVGGLILATVMTACAAPGSATPSASTAPSEEPTPSSTPFDVVSAFVGELADGVLGRATISGTLEVGSIHATLGGSYAFGLDNATRYEVTTTIGDSRTISRTIAVAGTTYTQQGEGPWLVQEPGSGGGSSGIEAAFAQIARLKDVGIVTWNGREVHSLQVPGGLTVPPAALGIADPSVQDPHAVVGFYALDDGTPAGMEMTMTWTQETGGAAVTGKMVMDVVFVHLGTAADIEPPEDVWQSYTSKTMNFSVAYPGRLVCRGS